MSFRALALFWLMTFGFGCAHSPDPIFYALSAQPGQHAPGRRVTVEMRRPALPGYLDRPHIVRRITAERLELAADERWAAPLDEMVGATLADDLSERLPDAVVYTESGTISSAPEVRVEVQLSRFERTPQGSVELRAELAVRWPGANDSVRMTRQSFSETPASGTTADLVATMSLLLGKLADGLAQTIISGPPSGLPSSTLPTAFPDPNSK